MIAAQDVDLVRCSIGLVIALVVAIETRELDLDQGRSLSRPGAFERFTHCIVDGKEIEPVDLNTRHAEGRRHD